MPAPPVPLETPKGGSAVINLEAAVASLAAYTNLPGGIQDYGAFRDGEVSPEAAKFNEMAQVGHNRKAPLKLDGMAQFGGETSLSYETYSSEEKMQHHFPPQVWDREIPPLSVPVSPRGPPPARPPSPERGEKPIFGVVGGDPQLAAAIKALPLSKARLNAIERDAPSRRPLSLQQAKERTLVIPRGYFSGFSRDNPVRVFAYECSCNESLQLVLR